MEPTGTTAKDVQKKTEIALLEKQVADWTRMGLVTQVVGLTIAVVVIVGVVMMNVAEVPLRYYRVFAVPNTLLGMGSLVALLTIASYVSTLKQRLAALRKA